MHQIVLLLKSESDPLIFFLFRERSVLVKSVLQILICNQTQRAAHIIHLLVSWIVPDDWCQASVDVFVLRTLVFPHQAATLLFWNIIKECPHCLIVLALIEALNIL